MADETQTETAVTPESPYSLRRIKSVLGKAGAMFGEIEQHFAPVYSTLLGEVAHETVPECAQALEDEIKAIQAHATDLIESLKAKLVATINAHLLKVDPATMNALYPPLDTATIPILPISPIAVTPTVPVEPAPASEVAQPVASDHLPVQNSGDTPPAATPNDRLGGL